MALFDRRKTYIINTPVPLGVGWGAALSYQCNWFEHVGGGIFRGYGSLNHDPNTYYLRWEVCCTKAQLTMLLLKTDCTIEE